MSELVDRVGGDTITATFHNQVKERSAMRYASAAARDASIPVPVAGSLAYLVNERILTLYDSGNWINVPNYAAIQNTPTDTVLSAAVDTFETVSFIGLPVSGLFQVTASFWMSSSLSQEIIYGIEILGNNSEIRRFDLLLNGTIQTSHRVPVHLVAQFQGNFGDGIDLRVKRNPSLSGFSEVRSAQITVTKIGA